MRRQSEHFDDYRAALGQLDAQGLLYPSFESRGEIARLVAEREATARGRAIPTARRSIPGIARSLSRGRARAAHRGRRALCAAARHGGGDRAHRRAHLDGDRRGAGRRDRHGRGRAAAWGDVVLARKETPTSYHLSVVVDDALQGVTHVVRGQDLFWSTSVHRLLQALLGLPAPVYHHHRLILDADGQKLSKSTPRDRPAGAAGGRCAALPTSAGWSGLPEWPASWPAACAVARLPPGVRCARTRTSAGKAVAPAQAARRRARRRRDAPRDRGDACRHRP